MTLEEEIYEIRKAIETIDLYVSRATEDLGRLTRNSKTEGPADLKGYALSVNENRIRNSASHIEAAAASIRRLIDRKNAPENYDPTGPPAGFLDK